MSYALEIMLVMKCWVERCPSDLAISFGHVSPSKPLAISSFESSTIFEYAEESLIRVHRAVVVYQQFVI